MAQMRRNGTHGARQNCTASDSGRQVLPAVTDRGCQNQTLFQKIISAQSSFTAWVKDNIAYEVLAERELTDAVKAAAVVRDAVLSRL